MTSSGHHFAIYALDVSDPDDPEQLWSRENLHGSGSQSSNPADFDMERCVSRPVIGYTLTDSEEADTSDNRTWHALFVGLDGDDNLMWLDLDPLTGTFRGTGFFPIEDTANGHGNGHGHNGQSATETLSPLQRENFYPSRILAAYPKEAAEAGRGSPVLSDVYVQLSNGSIYFWNLQETPPDGEAVPSPRKLMTVINSNGNNGEPCPPLSNFDLAYFDGKTYLATVVDFTPQGHGNSHDAPILLVFDLDSLLGDFRTSGVSSNLQVNIHKALGQGFNTIMPLNIKGSKNTYIMQMDWQGSSKEGDFDELLSDPVFLDGKLYLSAFTDTTDPDYTLLYHVPLNLFTDGKKTKIDKEGGSFPLESEIYTLIEASGNQMFVDTSGTLFVVNDDGGIVYSGDVMGNLSEISASDDVPLKESPMSIIYWREG